MDNICRRFPFASKKIFKDLDNQSLKRSKDVSKAIDDSLRNEKHFWIRIIKDHCKHFEDYEESWKEVIQNCPSEIVRELAITIQAHFKFNKWAGMESDQTWIFSNLFHKKVLIDPNDLHFYQNAP